AGIVDVKGKLHQKILSYEVIASDEDLPALVREYPYFLIALGQIQSAQKRVERFDDVKQLGAELPAIVSPLAYVSQHAVIHEGSIVMHNAFVNANAQIGRNCIINSAATIEHDTLIGDHCHISTGAIVNGDVRVGAGTFVGSNSVINQTLRIAPETVIGAGSVVVRPLDKAGTYAGNPARKIT
ncbi:MAG: acetyltransferase, partial [bacterium]|nr:acetyltransferase [bacterium]